MSGPDFAVLNPGYACPQKQTRPAANVRAGRFDRRGGGWGRTRRSQLSDPRGSPGRTFAHHSGAAQRRRKVRVPQLSVRAKLAARTLVATVGGQVQAAGN